MEHQAKQIGHQARLENNTKKSLNKVLTPKGIVIEYLQGDSPKQRSFKMKVQELHKAVLTAICQEISEGADSVLMVKFIEDDRIEAVFNFEHSSSYERLQDLSGILCRYGFIIGKIYFGEPTEIQIVSRVSDPFKTAIAKACSIFGLFTEDDQTIRELENVEEVGEIIACAMKHKII